MNVKNCRRCRRVFNYVMGPCLCPACREEMEQKFQEVKKYVQENIRTGIQDVAEACDVEPSQIRQWVREERLVFSDDSPLGLGCERCGKMIKSGRFCEECKKSMATGFQNAIGKPAPAKPAPKKTADKDSPRMRYLDK